jgi:hypothetical protein
MEIKPVAIEQWGAGGIGNDLESICSIPGRPNEFLIGESGDWQGRPGSIFHVKVDTALLKAEVLGSVRIPLLHNNDFGKTGDQYEAMACLEMEGEKKVIILAERGGSEAYPRGLIRWGVIDLKKHKLSFSDAGMKGMVVDVPGNWTNKKEKRDITDFYIDGNGFIWAAASEDHGDTGPFYSVVYQLGRVKEGDTNQPVQVFDKIVNFKEIPGVKIEALSGPCAGIESSHAFGTEDEIYGGIWRPIMIVEN